MENSTETINKDSYHFECKHYNMSIVKHIAIFLLGFAGLQVLSFIVGVIVASILTKHGFNLADSLIELKKYLAGETYDASMLSPYLIYAINVQVFSYVIVTIGCVLSLLKKDLINIVKDFKNKHSWINGLAFGALLIAGGTFIGIIINLFRGSSDVNANESMIRLLADNYYIPMFIVTVFCAPIVEEITYRLCVFGFLNKKNKWLALIVSALIFAFLHFDFTATGDDMINELWNLPTYIYSGVVLALAYSREGRLSDSIVAHAMNNMLSMLLMLIPA